jgi:tripartite-type tricarboxylate transporter receptor subunit TctC
MRFTCRQISKGDFMRTFRSSLCQSSPKRRQLAVMGASLLLAMSAWSSSANAQAFPAKTVTIVVPFPPGGGADALARVLVPRLNTLWGQNVIVEYKPGASGQIGADFVSRANPDGYTLLMATTAVINDKNVSKFTGVSLVSADAYVVVVHPSLPVRNAAELIAYGKANPKKLSFGSSGIGAASHLSAELFKAKAGIDMLHVPYKGTGPAMSDLIANHIQVMFAPTQTAMPQIQTGKIRPIAVTGAKTVEALPNVPPVFSSGLPDYQAVGWFGLLANASTPPELVKKLHDDVQRVMAMPEVRKDLQAKGAEPGNLSPAEFSLFVRQEQEKWAKLIKDAGIVIQ